MQSKAKRWPGGDIRATVSGNDFGRGGTARLMIRELTADGHTGGPFVCYRSFTEAGEFKFNLVPAEVVIVIDDIGDKPSDIRVELEDSRRLDTQPPPPTAAEQIAALQRRIEALEQRP